MRRLIISTVGTSLLTNYVTRYLEQEKVVLFRDTANSREEELELVQRDTIDAVAAEVESRLQNATAEEVRRLSAELNGIYMYYGDDLHAKRLEMDHHILLATDTYQGQKTAQLVRNHLKRTGFKSTEIMVPPGFRTRDGKSFTKGVNEIVKWCEETLPGYREQHYYIVFNLVGGFKSLQGYMNTLGMFYADEIIYIFEAPAAELIRIPRLPVVLDEIPVLREKADLFALLEKSYLAGREEVQGIPEIYLDFDDQGNYTLSTWGLLIWERNKQKILGSVPLMNFPALVYERSFEKDFQAISDKARKADVQSTLAEVSVLFRERGLVGLRSHRGLQYKNYENLLAEGIGHFRLSQDWRVSCLPEGQILRLRHVGPHDYVNGNP